MWFRKNKTDDEHNKKIVDSQRILLEAAVSTADMAQYVTAKLRQGLEDAIKQFEATAAILTDALLVCDSKGYIKACNPAAKKMFGDCLIKHSVLNLFRRHGSILSGPEELWSLLEPGVIQETVGLSGLRNGEHFPIEVTMTRLDRADGSIVMLMLVRDISNLNTLKKEAGLNARRYRSLFELCLDGILVVQNDRIVAANSQAGRLFGCRAESLLKVEFARLVEQEHREKLENIESEPVEASAIRDDGTLMSLLFSGTDIIWNDEPASLITVRDLTPIKLLDRQYNEIEMICCFDRDFKINFANDAFCKYYGISRTDSIGMDIRSLMSEGEKDVFILHINGLTPDHPARRINVHLNNSVQDWIDHAMFDSNGRITEVQRTGRDISGMVAQLQ